MTPLDNYGNSVFKPVKPLLYMRVIAHVDMDCFFAQCECKKDPSLVGKPLIVGANRDALRGIVCTASYEARAFGIHSAMPISKAVRLCPHGTFKNTNHAYYHEQSKNIMSVLQSFATNFLQVSCDEAYLDITHLLDDKDSWMTVARKIRKTVLDATGYTCSIGIAQSRRVAKIASDYKKPNGITCVFHAKNFLAPLPVQKISGIGKKSLPKFHSLGIKTINDLALKDKFFVLDHFGQWGYELWELANGRDQSTIQYRDVEKSHSKEHTFMTDVTNSRQMYTTLTQLAKSVHEQLDGCEFKTVTLKLRYSDFKTITRSFTLAFASSSLGDVLATVQKLLDKADLSMPVRLVGVKLDNLVYSQEQQLLLGAFVEV